MFWLFHIGIFIGKIIHCTESNKVKPIFATTLQEMFKSYEQIAMNFNSDTT